MVTGRFYLSLRYFPWVSVVLLNWLVRGFLHQITIDLMHKHISSSFTFFQVFNDFQLGLIYLIFKQSY